MDLPVFPLGSVLFPGQLLSLHIFEPRYQQMLQHCLAGDQEFGVVLIERGHEVGGGDVRSTVGTVARILQAVEVQAGHWAVVCAGVRRIRVDRWGADDPWPQASVTDLPDADGSAAGPVGAGIVGAGIAGAAAADTAAPVIDSHAAWSTLRRQFRKVVAMAAETGDEPVAVGDKIDDDPALGSYQVAALSPIGSFDRQKVLAAAGPLARMGLLSALLAEIEELLQATLQLGGDLDPPASEG